MAKTSEPITSKHPLEGIVTTIYLDAVTRKEKEGRAKVIAVLSSNKVNKTQDSYTCTVHFIGDRRGYNVQRDIVMRRVTL